MATAEQIELEPIVCPFVILIDSQEKQPFSFTGLHTNAAKQYRPLIVRTEWQSLGIGMGDYSIKGFAGAISIERKSLEDFHGTVLGWGEHRDRFERELENLNQMQFAAVVVEASWGDCLDLAPEWGKKSAAENRQALIGSIRSWRQRFNRVQWEFCDSRRMAEETAFDHLRRFWAHAVREKRRQYAKRFRKLGII